METIEYAGRKLKCEKLCEDAFKEGASAFKMVDEDGYTSYGVFTPPTLADHIEGKEIKTPKDGMLCALCPNVAAALMVATSIGIANKVTRSTLLGAKTRDIFDTDAMKREVDKLRSEGKSLDEVVGIMTPRMNEFKKRDSQPDMKGEW